MGLWCGAGKLRELWDSLSELHSSVCVKDDWKGQRHNDITNQQPTTNTQLHPICGTGRQQTTVGTLLQKAVYTVKGVPEDGRNCRPKHAK